MDASGYRIGAIAAALLLASAAGADQVVDLNDGRSTAWLSARRGDDIDFRIQVAPGTDRLVVTTAGGSGDCDLYLAFGRRPTPKDYAYRSDDEDTDERIAVKRPRAGTWRLLVRACERFSEVALEVRTERRGVGRLRITSPDGGDVWRAGGEYTVKWRADRHVDRVRVQLSLDDGRTWQYAGHGAAVDADRERLRVRLPDSRLLGTREARVRIVDADRGAVLDTSERFRIVGRRPARSSVVVILRWPPVLRPRRPVVHVPPRRKHEPADHKPPKAPPAPRRETGRRDKPAARSDRDRPRPRARVEPQPRAGKAPSEPAARSGGDRRRPRSQSRAERKPRPEKVEKGESARRGRARRPRRR